MGELARFKLKAATKFVGLFCDHLTCMHEQALSVKDCIEQ